MLILPLEEAREGMKLAAPVFHPENPDQQLLRRGFVLEDSILRRMADMHIAFLYVEYPPLDYLDQHLGVYASPARQDMLQKMKRVITTAQTQARPAISYSDYSDTMRSMIQTLMEQGKHPLYMDQMARIGGDAIGHGTAVAHLSLLLGLKLEQYLIEQRKRLPAGRAREIVNLGIAGMLHDLGKMKLPESLRNFTDSTPPENDKERAEWQSHARLGYEMIHGEVEPTAAAAVLQHHQHFDGSGFPKMDAGPDAISCMDGERIHVFARILTCANLYDRLSTPVEGKRRSNAEVLRLMREQYAAWVDPQILRTLQTIIPPYPPGSRVRLGDGSWAIVTAVDPDDAAQPTVQRLAADLWTPLDQPIDLHDAPELAIVG